MTFTSEAFCPHCGAKRPEWARFCAACGNGYDASPAGSPPAVTEAPATLVAEQTPIAAQAPTMARRPRPVQVLAAASFLVLAAVMVAGWLGSQNARVDDIVATATGWTLDRAQSFAAAEGFIGKVSSLADGTPRWLANRASDQAIFEAVGQPASIESVSLVLPVTADNASPMGVLVGRALGVWLPEAADWLAVEIGDIVDQGGDVSKTFPHGSVRVQSVVVSDGALVTVTVSRAP